MMILGWDCLTECQYKCTWQTVHYFSTSQSITPRFFGSFPLERIFGLREAASSVFLLFSCFVQSIGFYKFYKGTPKSSPIRSLIVTQGIILLAVSSLAAVYHSKKEGNPKLNTENDENNHIFYLGKVVALGVTYAVLHFMYIGVYRFLWRKMPAEVKSVWFSLQMIFLVYAVLSISLLHDMGPYEFFYPNFFLGVSTGILWSLFCFKHFYILSHVWKLAVLLGGFLVISILQVEDFIPLWNILDAHSIWNFCVCPLWLVWYSFCIDDAFYLYREVSAFKIE